MFGCSDFVHRTVFYHFFGITCTDQSLSIQQVYRLPPVSFLCTVCFMQAHDGQNIALVEEVKNSLIKEVKCERK